MASPYLLLSSPDLSKPMFLLMGEAAPTISGGDGGFEEVSRQRRKAFTEWSGQTALRMDVSLVIDGRRIEDGAASVASVESVIARLTRVSRSSKDFTRPPIVRLFGAGLPAQALPVEWVIASLAWGAAERNERGVRIRQEATLTLLEYIEPDIGLTKKKFNLADYRLVSVGAYKSGPVFALKHLGKASRWKDIAAINGKIRGPMIPKKFWGKKLKVPRR